MPANTTKPRLFLFALAAPLLAAFSAAAQDGGATEGAPPAAAPPSVFDAPRLERGRIAAGAVVAAGDAEAGARALETLFAQAPRDGVIGGALIAAYLAEGRRDAAERILRVLAEADPCALVAARRDSAPLALPPGVDCAADPPPPAAAVGPDGAAPVGPENVIWDRRSRKLRVGFEFPARPARPAAAPAEDADAATRLLARLQAQGRAAGNHGDVYDNRDRGHVDFGRNAPPRIARTVYAPEAVAADADFSLNEFLSFGAPTIGNAALALTGGPLRRSLPRLAMTSPGSAARVCARYAEGQLYVHPAHNDHTAEYGDLFPAAPACMIVSDGASFSVRPHLRAIATIYAAFRPDAKEALVRAGLIAETAAMIHRRGMAGIETDSDYLDPAAHPAAFAGGRIDLERMIRLANAIEPDALPPAARIAVVAEERPAPWSDDVAAGLSRVLYDTPFAAARVFRGYGATRRFTLDASASFDAGGRPLRYLWRVLRGDPAGVRITPRGLDGAVADVEIDWRDRVPAAAPGGFDAGRVDIAVFVDNGVHLSAPATFSLAFPPRERRVVENGRLVSIDFDAPENRDRPADPVMFVERRWSDRFDHDADGRLVGWTRRRGDVEEAYAWHGARVIETDGLGRPVRSEEIGYRRESGDRGRIRLEPEPTGRVFGYRYRDDADRVGSPFLLSGAP